VAAHRFERLAPARLNGRLAPVRRHRAHDRAPDARAPELGPPSRRVRVAKPALVADRVERRARHRRRVEVGAPSCVCSQEHCDDSRGAGATWPRQCGHVSGWLPRWQPRWLPRWPATLLVTKKNRPAHRGVRITNKMVPHHATRSCRVDCTPAPSRDCAVPWRRAAARPLMPARQLAVVSRQRGRKRGNAQSPKSLRSAAECRRETQTPTGTAAVVHPQRPLRPNFRRQPRRLPA
jgi:hypothetical protein